MDDAIAEPRTDAAQAEATVAAHVAGWLSATRARYKSVAELALAETKLAATSVAIMAFLGAIAAMLLMSAWGLVVAGGVLFLLAAGVPLWVQFLVLTLVHVAAAIALVRRVRTLSTYLDFPETRRQLATNKET